MTTTLREDNETETETDRNQKKCSTDPDGGTCDCDALLELACYWLVQQLKRQSCWWW